MQYVYWWEYGGGTGWVFRGDAKLAHSAVWLGCVCGRTGLLFWGDAELARERDSAGCVCEFVGRMIYDTSRSESHKQSLFDRWRRQLTNQK